MSTRGLMTLRHGGRDFITYIHSDAYPRGQGSRIIRFALDHLDSEEAIGRFGGMVARLTWVSRARGPRLTDPQGGDLLAAIARGAATHVHADPEALRTRHDCEFAYVLDLDAGVLEFWELPWRVEAFALESLSSCAVDVMECARSR